MPLRIDILTLFVDFFEPFLSTSIVGRAIKSGAVEIVLTDIRDFASNAYGSVDDKPYGGGPGMVLQCGPVYAAIEHVRKQNEPEGEVVMLSPQGQPLTQKLIDQFSRLERMILLAGHYEGFDERIRTGIVDREVSIGDFVLSGGEIPAMAVTDAVVRLLPGALGTDESTREESYRGGLLEYPQYTRPREFRDMVVPDVLLNGNHAEIEQWRSEQAELRTRERRSDMWDAYNRNAGEQRTQGNYSEQDSV